MNSPASQAQGQRFRLATKFLVAFVTLVACLAMLEIGLRATGRQRLGSLQGFLQQGGVSYWHKSNVTKRVEWSQVSFSIYTDDKGFRYKRPGPRSLGGKPYYAVMGSSEVFGNGLNYEQTFIGVLAEGLERDGIDIANMAVAGHHLVEQMSVFEAYSSSATSQPEKVLIVLNPLLIGGYDDNHDHTRVIMGDLFPEDGWRLPVARMILASLSADYCFFRDTIQNARLKYSRPRDYDLSFYLERYATAHPIRSPEKTRDFLNRLKSLERRIRSVGATPVCIYSPAVGGFLLNDLIAKGKLDKNLVDTRFFPELARSHCAEEGIQFINLEPLLQERYDRGEKLNFDMDAHFNGPTSRVIGEYLYAALKPSSGTTKE
jgi:hypothetical protein